ncbi:MAG: hypothetical protein A3F33_02695 [Candidatus Woykebacteria bacterium RIFCSPHIGHO2_12_FULL_43_10]|nr:MAG: hypothetical protein A3F33_02695 [Candidatus Woykebacteria bacterium RIFCSPHIGHO2_12_FULL_43_10]
MKVVGTGGGAGLPHILRGVRSVASRWTGVVAVTDDGRSTKVAREIWDVPAPGDFRNAICELAVYNRWLAQIFQQRLELEGNVLDGMALGNQVLAMAGHLNNGMMGEVMAAFNDLFLPPNERLWPATLANIHICAKTADGAYYEGELDVRKADKPRIVEFGLTRAAGLYREAKDAIDEADLVFIGPGSLFSSQLPFFYLNGSIEALQRCPGIVGVIMNSTTQPGQTIALNPDGSTYHFSVYDHLKFIVDKAGKGIIDFVLVDESPLSEEIWKRLDEAGRRYLIVGAEEEVRIELELGIRVFRMGITEVNGAIRKFWNKEDAIVYHDPDSVTRALLEIHEMLSNERRLAVTIPRGGSLVTA